MIDRRKILQFLVRSRKLTPSEFFAIRPTDYSKANEGEDFEDIW